MFLPVPLPEAIDVTRTARRGRRFEKLFDLFDSADMMVLCKTLALKFDVSDVI